MLSIAAPFSRDAVLPQGEVTIRDIGGLYIYDNTLEAVTLNGRSCAATGVLGTEFFVENWQLTVGGEPVG